MTGIKFDSGKPRWSLLPQGVVAEVVQVLEFGAQKYAPDNWRKVPDGYNRYYDAAMRHIEAWWTGEERDKETQLHHLAHAICCLMFLVSKDNEANASLNFTSQQGKEFSLNKMNQEMYARLFKLLLEEPMTAHDMVEETGVHIVTAQNLMRCFLKHKVVHICGWEKDSKGRDATPVYKLGRGRNKPRAKLTAAQRTQRYREKKQALLVQNLIVKRRTDELPALPT